MRYLKSLFLCCFLLSLGTVPYAEAQQKEGVVSGIVSDGSNPLYGVRVSVVDDFLETATDEAGYFKLNVPEGTPLLFELLGRAAAILDAEVDMKVQLEMQAEVLAQVELRNQKKKTYLDRKRKFESELFADMHITEDDILPSQTNLVQIIRGKAGITTTSNFLDPSSPIYAFRRAGKNVVPVVLIDDLPFIQNPELPVPYPDLSEIKSLSFIPPEIARFKYGPDAVSGAIVIRTKAIENYLEKQAELKRLEKIKKKEETTFNEAVSRFEDHLVFPNYMATLSNAKSFEEAKTIYESQSKERSQYGISYYVNAATYFNDWDLKYAIGILNEIAVVASTNTRALRTAAYQLDALNAFEDSNKIYDQIFQLNPTQPQAYRDWGNSLIEIGKLDEALLLYTQMIANETPGIDFRRLKKIAEQELCRLTMMHKNSLDVSFLPDYLVKECQSSDVRLVLEWNDPMTEFEIQFVNPEGKHYAWKRDLFENKGRLMQEKKMGFSMDQYTVPVSLEGTWMVNLQNLGHENPSKNPAYLKLTRYLNFGKANEQKDIKVVRIDKFYEKYILDQFVFKN